jgi:GAF domain-containing protein
MNSSLTDAFDALLGAPDRSPEFVLNETVRLVGEALHADRCFLCIRNPETEQSRIAFVWRRDESIPDVAPAHRAWADDAPIRAEDPLYRAALDLRPSVYVEDVETATPEVLDRAFEAAHFGHRALIHAHVVEGGTLWAILQPAVFDAPRVWTDMERDWIEKLVPKLIGPVRAIVETSPD